MESASKRNFCTPPPSPKGTVDFKRDMTCSNMLKVTIEADIESADWNRFNLILPKETQQLFINNILGDMLKELLYDNPELLSSYLKRAAQRR